MKTLSNRRGSSSVLIILILICLTTFSVLAVMSAYSDVKLARKRLASAKSFYALDTLGERTLRDVTHLADEANTFAAQYAADGAYRSPVHPELPGEAANALFLKYSGASPSESEFLTLRAEAALSYLAARPPSGDSVTTSFDEEGRLHFSCSLSHPDYPENYLTAVFRLAPDDTGGIDVEILSWAISQEPFEYTEKSYEIWGGGPLFQGVNP